MPPSVVGGPRPENDGQTGFHFYPHFLSQNKVTVEFLCHNVCNKIVLRLSWYSSVQLRLKHTVNSFVRGKVRVQCVWWWGA